MNASNAVSLCMIVRDGAERLAACLASAADLVDQIVVVNTGSQDSSRDVARSFRAEVFDARWANSFSEARNESLLRATCPWVFWLDHDEELSPESRRRFGALRDRLAEPRAYLMRQSSRNASDGMPFEVDQVRLFPRLPNVRWRYRVHEQIAPSLKASGVPLKPTDIVIEHYGYAVAADLDAKRARNIELAKLDHADAPTDPFVLYNLGNGLVESGDLAGAVAILAECIEQASGRRHYLRTAHFQRTVCLLRLRRYSEAERQCRHGLADFPNDVGLMCQLARLLAARRRWTEAESLLNDAERVATQNVATGFSESHLRAMAATVRHEIRSLQGSLPENRKP